MLGGFLLSEPRYHAFDTLRAGAMVLGIFFHGALSFMDPASITWSVQDESHSIVVSAFVWASHSFRLQVFFVMSGFFAHMLFHRYGTNRFLVHRAKRILLPALIGIVLMDALMRGYLASGATAIQVRSAEIGGSLWGYLQALDSVHLWFLFYLVYLSAGALALRAILIRSFGGPHWGPVDRAVRALASSPWRPLWLSLPIAAVFLWHGSWVIGGPGGYIAPDAKWIVYYGLFFGFGWLLHRQVDLLDALKRHAGVYLALALPVGAVALGGVAASEDYGNLALLFPATAIFSSLFTSLMLFGSMGMCLRVFRNESVVARYLSDSAYWLYLAHIPIVIYLQSVVAGMSTVWPIKYAIVCLGSTALLLTSYELFVRYSPIGTALNGPRVRGSRKALAVKPGL